MIKKPSDHINTKFDTVDEILHLEVLSKKQAKVFAERYTF